MLLSTSVHFFYEVLYKKNYKFTSMDWLIDRLIDWSIDRLILYFDTHSTWVALRLQNVSGGTLNSTHSCELRTLCLSVDPPGDKACRSQSNHSRTDGSARVQLSIHRRILWRFLQRWRNQHLHGVHGLFLRRHTSRFDYRFLFPRFTTRNSCIRLLIYQ